MNIIGLLILLYVTVALQLIAVHLFMGYPKYLAQSAFWPIAIIVEIVLSTIRWIKSIEV